jgi:predicted nuclease with TOPRIM domain
MQLLTKIWVWLKHYWYVPLIVIGIILSTMFMFKNQSAYKLLLQVQENYKKQISELQRLWDEEKKKKEELQKQYELTMQLIEMKYKEDQRVLDMAEKKRVKDLVSKYQDNPEELSKQLAEAYGIKYGG